MKEIIDSLRKLQQQMHDQKRSVYEQISPFKIGEIVEVTRGEYWKTAIVADIINAWTDEDGVGAHLKCLEFSERGEATQVRNVFYHEHDPEDPTPRIRKIATQAAA